MNYGQRFVTLYRRQGSRPYLWKRNAKSKMAVWGGLTNSCEKKRSKKQRRKGKRSRNVLGAPRQGWGGRSLRKEQGLKDQFFVSR